MKRWLGMSVLLVLLTAALAPSTHAQQTWSSTEEFRTEYLRLLDSLSQRIPSSDQSSWAVDLRGKIADLQQQVKALSDTQLDQFSKLTDGQAFTRMIDGLNSGDRLGRDQRNVKNAPSLDGAPGAVIVPPDFSGAVAGTTCDTSPTSAATIDGEKVGLYVDRGLSLIAEVACETIVEVLGEGTNAPFCIAFGVTKGVEVVLDSLIDHQLFCNDLLAGATQDAILADVINVHGDVGALDTHLTNVNNQITNEFTALDTHVTNVDNHIANEFTALDNHLVTLFTQLTGQITETTKLLNADLRQVMKLELTPEGLRKIVPEILTCTGTNCPNVLANCPAAGCSWNNVGPLP